jgi:hypothetical protein
MQKSRRKKKVVNILCISNVISKYALNYDVLAFAFQNDHVLCFLHFCNNLGLSVCLVMKIQLTAAGI